jgi:Helix-turn-helix domain
MKKKELLTVKELAAELRMSVKSIQRAYREGDIPVQWLRRMARFNLAKVQRAMERNGRSRMLRLKSTASLQGATGGAAAGAHRRIAPAR